MGTASRRGRNPGLFAPEAGDGATNLILLLAATASLSAAPASPPPPLAVCPILASGSPGPENSPTLGPFVVPGLGPLAEPATTAWVAWSGDALVVVVRCDDPEPDQIVARPLAHDSDEMWKQDSIEVFVAPSDPTRQYFHFVVTARGDLLDQMVPGVVDRRDPSWESGASARAEIDGAGWTATLNVPGTALGGAPRAGDAWRLNICREYRGGESLMTWAQLSVAGFHEPGAFGEVRFASDAPRLLIRTDSPFVGRNRVEVHAPPALNAVCTAHIAGPASLEVPVSGGLYPIPPAEQGSVQLVVEIGDRTVARSAAIGWHAPDLASSAHALVISADAAAKVLSRARPSEARTREMAALSALQASAREIGRWVDGAASRPAGDNRGRWNEMAALCRRLRAAAARCTAVARALAAGNATTPRLIAGVETALRKLHPEDWDFATGVPARLSAARREAESIQIVLAPLEARVAVRDATCSPLVTRSGNRLPASTARIDRVGYVTTRPPSYEVEYVGEWPDPLMPLEPFDLPEGRIQPLWLTVTVPPDARPGLYHGTVTIVDDRGERYSVPVELTVWDFELPLRGKLKTAISTGYSPYVTNFYKWPEGEIPDSYLFRFYDLMLSHRINPVAIYQPRMWPPVEHLDYCKARGLNSICMLCTGSADPAQFEQVRGYMEELRKRDLLDGAYIYGFDEAQPTAWPGVREAWRAWKDAIPDVRIAGTYPPNEVLDDAVDIWVPLTPWYDSADAAVASKHLAAGDEMWWYVCCGPTHPFQNWFIDYPATDARGLFWATWKYRITGFLYYETCIWTSNTYAESRYGWDVPHEDPAALDALRAGKRWPEVPWNTYTYSRFNGDGLLVYPGPNETPLSSVRLETIRDGIEDYEMLGVLADLVAELERAHPASAELIRARRLLRVNPEIVTDLTHYTRSPEAIATERQRVAECILAVKTRLAQQR